MHWHKNCTTETCSLFFKVSKIWNMPARVCVCVCVCVCVHRHVFLFTYIQDLILDIYSALTYVPAGHATHTQGSPKMRPNYCIKIYLHICRYSYYRQTLLAEACCIRISTTFRRIWWRHELPGHVDIECQQFDEPLEDGRLFVTLQQYRYWVIIREYGWFRQNMQKFSCLLTTAFIVREFA